MKKTAILFAALLFFGMMNLYAPPADLGDDPIGNPPVGDDPPVSVPIDGGAIALLIAGSAYGAKKMREKKKNKI